MWCHAIACDMNLCMSHDSYIHTLTLNYFWTAVTHTHTPQSPIRTRVWHTPVYTPQKNMAQKKKASSSSVLIRASACTPAFVFQRDSLICDMHPSNATWLVHVWQHSFMRDTTHLSVTWTHPRHTSHPYIHHYTFVFSATVTHALAQTPCTHATKTKVAGPKCTHTPTYTPKTKQWQWTKISFSSSVLIHASARTPVFHFFFGADMEGSSLKETYNEPQFKRALLPHIKCTLFAACVTWLIRSCDVTHSCVTWPIHSHEMAHSHVTWLIHVWHYSFIRDMTQLFMCHDSFMCDMTHIYMDAQLFMRHCHMNHVCVTWLIHAWHDSSMCDMTHLYEAWLIHLWHDLFIYHMTAVMRDMTRSCLTWLTYMRHDSIMRDMTYPFVTWLIHVWHASCIYDVTLSCVTWPIHMQHDLLLSLLFFWHRYWRHLLKPYTLKETSYQKSVLPCDSACCSVLPCVVVRCSALQCVAVRCSAL